MTAADIIRESFLFSDGETPPVDAQFEVRLSEGENVILSYWIGSAANMFENCWKAIDSGVHDDDQDFIAYVERYCPRGAAAIAVECVNRISAGGGFAVLSCGELCVLAVLARRRIPAMFFVIGEKLRDPKARALAEQARDAGHVIGNHTLTHGAPLGRRSADEALHEISATEALAL